MNNELNAKAKQIKADILKSLHACQSGHPDGSLLCVETLLALYENVMKYDPKNPHMEDRDRLVVSEGHACPTLYAVLTNKGLFPKGDLQHLRQADSHLQGHPDMTKTPGVDYNTGSLGQGISIAGGMAIAAKCKKADHKVYALIGGSEMQEGLVWEAAMSAVHYKLDNFTVLLNFNHFQVDGGNDQVMNVGDPIEKFRAFGLGCLEVDGHDIDAITETIKRPIVGKSKFICCHTHKGHGISFVEDNRGWHGKPMSKDDFAAAMKELGVEIDDWEKIFKNNIRRGSGRAWREER